MEGLITVFPSNFDNPDEVFATAKAWAEHREGKLLGGGGGIESRNVICATWLDGEPARSANNPRRRFKLVLSDGLPSKPGVYSFYTVDAFYVGETTNLKQRMDQYANAGMVENPIKEYTNRSIQRKIYESLEKGEIVELRYCISAHIQGEAETLFKLDFEKKYHRTLVESLVVSTQPDRLICWNKQH